MRRRCTQRPLVTQLVRVCVMVQDYFVKGDFLGKVSVPLSRITAKHDAVHAQAHKRVAALRDSMGGSTSYQDVVRDLVAADMNAERPPNDPYWEQFGTDPLLFVRLHVVATPCPAVPELGLELTGAATCVCAWTYP